MKLEQIIHHVANDELIVAQISEQGVKIVKGLFDTNASDAAAREYKEEKVYDFHDENGAVEILFSLYRSVLDGDLVIIDQELI